MKVLHCLWTLTTGGSEEMLVDIVNEQRHCAEVTILVLNNEIDDGLRGRIDSAVTFLALRRQPGSRSLMPLFRLHSLISQVQPDIIHLHDWGLTNVLPFRRQQMVLTVHTTRTTVRKRVPKRVPRLGRIFAISKAVADDIQHKYGLRQPVVINGVRTGDIRCEVRANGGPFRIVQIARLDHNCKGQDLLIQAVARIRDQYPTIDISLDLIGDGESRGYLEGMASEFGLNRVVTFRGTIPRSQIYEELCRYDLLVQASRYEGFGLAVVEAMVAGVPVLVSDLEGPREIVEKGRLGFLFQPESVEDCAGQIASIHDLRATDTLAQMIGAARQHALEMYDVRRTAEQYLAAYREVILARGRDKERSKGC
jgi:glycosyltransferase involved in cell wall biosynthesis